MTGARTHLSIACTSAPEITNLRKPSLSWFHDLILSQRPKKQ